MEQVLEAYQLILHREADSSGANYWSTSGLYNDDLLRAITSSSHQVYSSMSESELVSFQSQYGGDRSVTDPFTGAFTQYAVGTASVPYDMTANIHKNEIIVPATFSDGLRNGDLTMGNNDDVKKQNELLREIIAELQSQSKRDDDTQDILNESLVKLEEIEEVV